MTRTTRVLTPLAILAGMAAAFWIGRDSTDPGAPAGATERPARRKADEPSLQGTEPPPVAAPPAEVAPPAPPVEEKSKLPDAYRDIRNARPALALVLGAVDGVRKQYGEKDRAWIASFKSDRYGRTQGVVRAEVSSQLDAIVRALDQDRRLDGGRFQHADLPRGEDGTYAASFSFRAPATADEDWEPAKGLELQAVRDVVKSAGAQMRSATAERYDSGTAPRRWRQYEIQLPDAARLATTLADLDALPGVRLTEIGFQAPGAGPFNLTVELTVRLAEPGR